MITQSFASWLMNNPTITAITTDIRPQVLGDDHADPALTYHMTYDEKPRVFEGISTLRQAGFQVDCWSQHYEQVKTLADAVASELKDYAGTFGDYEAEQTSVDTERDSFERSTKLHRVTVSIDVWFTG